MERKMNDDFDSISKQKNNTRAGIKFHLDMFDDKDPVDINLSYKNSGDDKAELMHDENAFQAKARLVFKFGKKGFLKLFADRTYSIDELPQHAGGFLDTDISNEEE
jgi:hypothetical protein